MNLVIDVGNSFVKLAVFKGKNLGEVQKHPPEKFLQAVENLFKKYPDIRRALVSSVGALNNSELEALKVFCEVYELTNRSRVPFINAYKTPETLGVDRIALVTAAYYLFPNTSCLVIDAGSCITYDLLTADGQYLGGGISPGIRMRFRAMHEFTQKLPLLSPDSGIEEKLIGQTTSEAMTSGVVFGTLNEIDGVISDYSKKNKDLTVILTGGDCGFLSKRLKSTIFAHSNFLLEGLNYILELNKH